MNVFISSRISYVLIFSYYTTADNNSDVLAENRDVNFYKSEEKNCDKNKMGIRGHDVMTPAGNEVMII